MASPAERLIPPHGHREIPGWRLAFEHAFGNRRPFRSEEALSSWRFFVHVLRTDGPFAGLVALGMALRFAALSRWAIVYDGAVYAVMGESFAQHGEFLVPYAQGTVYYHHYPPLYPMVLSVFYPPSASPSGRRSLRRWSCPSP